MHKFFSRKKGGERIITFYWVLTFVMIAVFIIGATIVFYAETVDVRAIEADILANKAISCITDNNFLDSINSEGFDFKKQCSMNLGEDFSVYIGVYDPSSCSFSPEIKCNNLIKEKLFGADYRDYCELQEIRGKQRKLPQCSRKYFYGITKSGEARIVMLLAASNHKSNEIWKS